MKKTLGFICAALCASAVSTQAVVLAGWDFGNSLTSTQGTDPATGDPTVLASGVIVTSALDGVGGLNNWVPFVHDTATIGDNTGFAASGTAFGRTDSGNFGQTTEGATANSLANAITANDYVTFTIAVDTPGTTLNISDFSVGGAVASTTNNRPADTWNVLAQVNGGSTWVAANALLTTDKVIGVVQGLTAFDDIHIDLSGDSTFQGITSVEFRIYMWGSNGNGTTSRGQIDNLVVEGTVAIPEPSSAALLGLGGLALILRRRK
ncbi:MAG: PEP-CTERM sorting domain-containing protein [Akkermansiaceae bacterium]|nr:PEP-CTERM sorting domain-containing protein [Akkermansiaceae bacterium]